MKNNLPQSAYINSTDGNVEEFDASIRNAAQYQEFNDGISVALRFSEQLIEAQKSGKIKMTSAEYKDLLDNYKKLRGVADGKY
jgi:hypothetical protein